MTLYKSLSSIFVLLLLATSLMAQPPDDELDTDEVEVVKDFEARLIESKKLNSEPSLPPIDTSSERLVYDIESKVLEISYPAPKIRPVAMPRAEVPKAYKGYLKLGYGLPASPYAELGYFTSQKKLDIGGQVRHHSANFKDIENQRFSETGAKIEGAYHLESGAAVGTNVGYNVDEIHYYGYDHEVDTFNREFIRQQFKIFDFGAKFYNAERTVGDINYFVSTDFYYLQDNFAVKERGSLFELGGTKWFDEAHPLSVVIKTDFTSLDDSPADGSRVQKLHNFSIAPRFTYHGDGFSAKVGGSLIAHDDKFKLFPDLEVNVNVLGNQLAAYAGWKGDLQKNTLRSISDYNPFILTRNVDTLSNRLIIENTQYQQFYGGVKGNIQILDYQIQAGYKQTKNLALFISDPFDTTKFNVLYDTVNIFQIEGTLNAEPIKGLNVTLSLGSNNYSFVYNPVDPNDSKGRKRAWHLPRFTMNIGASYLTLNDKLRVKAEFYTQNRIHFLDKNGEIGRLNSLFDIGFGAEYFIGKNLGIFFDINNLASNKRERWNNYPTYGLNILGGISARF